MGANFNIEDYKTGVTPLCWARWMGYEDVAVLLESRGARWRWKDTECRKIKDGLPIYKEWRAVDDEQKSSGSKKLKTSEEN